MIHQAPKFQPRSVHWFHHLKAQGQADPRATFGFLASEIKVAASEKEQEEGLLWMLRNVETAAPHSATLKHCPQLAFW